MILRILLSIWLVAAALPAAAQDSWLSVTGEGIARTNRLVAVLQVEVAARDTNARPAMEEAGRVLDRLTRRMRAMTQVDAVVAGPVGLTNLREHPGRLGRQGAWLAEARLTVTLTAAGAVAEVTGELLSGGAQAIGAISYRAADPDSLCQTALERAVDDARRKAQGMAAAAQVRLGPVLEILGQETQVLGPEDGAPYAAGRVTVRARATLVFGISH